MGEFTYSVERVDEAGIFNFGSFDLSTENSTYHIPLPVVTAPVKHCSSNHDIYSEFKRINEVFHTIDSTDLRQAVSVETPGFVKDIKRKQQYSDRDQLDLVLLHYDDTKAMTPLEAQEFLRAIDEVSDVLTCPLQFSLLHALVAGETVDSLADPFPNFFRTKKHFLEAAAALNSSKPVMGALSFIPTGRLHRMIELYTEFDVEILGVDFSSTQPTSVSDAELGRLIGSLSAFDLFDGSVMLAYNMSRRPNRPSSDLKRAEDFAPVGMGFDILGGNHLGLAYAPEGERTNHWIFDRDVAGYRRIGVDSVIEDWPVTVQSNILPADVANFQPSTADNLIKLICAEQMQSSLFELRTRLENGHHSNFLENKAGIDPSMTAAFQSTLDAYRAGMGPGFDQYR